MRRSSSPIWIGVLALLLCACRHAGSPNAAMAARLDEIARRNFSHKNVFCAEARNKHYDSALSAARNFHDSARATIGLARALLEMGNEKQAIDLLTAMINRRVVWDYQLQKMAWKTLGLAFFRQGERTNCIAMHAAESCIFPIAGRGIHHDKSAGYEAIRMYETLLQQDPGDLEARWLLNIAYMTVGGYPHQVPDAWLIKGLDERATQAVKPFTDVAVQMGLDIKNQAGGCIVDDFNNDHYPDIVTSSWSLHEGMHYCRNNANGSFGDASRVSGLQAMSGGLNIIQTDYNNDGWKDVFVLRGAWKGEYGCEPNSLLRNNGDGTFTDVTEACGLLSFHPCQTATWADFNNDGWLDVFIGNETSASGPAHPCEMYINNGQGKFTEKAVVANCNIALFVKGVTSGDYNNDGWQDIFVSTMNGKKILLRNDGLKNGEVHFTDVSVQAGLDKNRTRTFPTWFWDYNNDGWPDILVCGYELNGPLALYAANEALGRGTGNSGKVFLFRNDGNGAFTEVTDSVGLNKVAFAMGCNFGDIDNDGYLDIYLGTGNPGYESLVPNKLFKNENGKFFHDITVAAHVGNLQKGHGVAFSDLDNDGDQDIYIEMGGAYPGDAYQNALYLNPGQNDNHWLRVCLQGVTCNRPAIGARIKVTFDENGQERVVYRDVNPGGSFGSNPLTQHIGLGRAREVTRIEIKWPGSNDVQVLENIAAGQQIIIRQGQGGFEKVVLQAFEYGRNYVGCAPVE